MGDWAYTARRREPKMKIPDNSDYPSIGAAKDAINLYFF